VEQRVPRAGALIPILPRDRQTLLERGTTVALNQHRLAGSWRVPLVLACFCISAAVPAAAADSKLALVLHTEENAAVTASVAITSTAQRRLSGKPRSAACPGEVTIDFTGYQNDTYRVEILAPGFAAQSHRVEVQDGVVTPARIATTLYKKRYVIVEYAVNAAGGRALTGNDVEAGVCAVSHWAGLPVFAADWQVWQLPEGGISDGVVGTTPWFHKHRCSKGYGFAEPPPGSDYEKLLEAPDPGRIDAAANALVYQCKSYPARPGLVLFGRVRGHQRDETGRYGKLRVLDVVAKVPEGVRNIQFPDAFPQSDDAAPAATAAANDWGSVRGRIVVEGMVEPEFLVRAGDPIYAAQSLSDNVRRVPRRQIGKQPADVPNKAVRVDAESGGLRDAFVYLRKAPDSVHPDGARVPDQPVEVRRPSRWEFEPRCAVVRANQTVRVVRKFDDACTVHGTTFRNPGFLFSLSGDRRERELVLRLSEPMPIRVNDDLQAFAEGYWLVLDHPYGTTSGADGAFEIRDLPAGRHELRIWHERAGWIAKSLAVEVQLGETTSLPTIRVPAEKLRASSN